MTIRRRFLQTTKLATAAFLATGLAASPLVLSGLNGAVAQPAASTGGEGAAEEFVKGSESSEAVDSETTMESTEDEITRDSTTDMDPEMDSRTDDVTIDSARDDATMESTTDEMMTEPFTHTAAYDDYEAAMTEGNLDSAAEALAEATERPITEDFVLEVNRELGIESTLPAEQVATAASAKQDEDY